MSEIQTLGNLISALSVPSFEMGDEAEDCKGVKVYFKVIEGQVLPFKYNTNELYKRSEDAFIEKVWRNGELIWEYSK